MEAKMIDEPVPTPEPSDTHADEPLRDLDELRRRRIQEYLDDALNKPNPLSATLGGFSAGLMVMALRLEQEIAERFATANHGKDRLERTFSSIDVHLKLLRQVDRFVQLESRNNGRRSVGE
jgi:hypothetical protein